MTWDMGREGKEDYEGEREGKEKRGGSFRLKIHAGESEINIAKRKEVFM